MSRTDIVDEAKAAAAMELLRGINSKAAIITTPIANLDGKKILEVMEHPVSLEQEMLEEEVCPECGHIHEHGHHHHEEEHSHSHEEHEHHHDHECGCGEDHHHEEHEHHHDHECGCGEDHHHEEHEHHHDHECGCGHDHHHGHHHADEVFTSWGRETIKNIQKKNWKKSWIHCQNLRNMEPSSGQRECFPARTEPGSILIWYRRKQRSAPARRNIQAVSA